MTAEQKARGHAFSTRVFPSLLALLPITLVAPSVALVVLPFMSDIVALMIGLTVASVIFVAVLAYSPIVSVSSGEQPQLQVGRAKIPLSLIQKAEIVTGNQLRFEKGPGLKANAYFVNQAGSKAFVKVTIADKKDPTPYWLFACNKPEDLVVALGANR